MNIKDKFAASLLGGAIGDALGYPVEFMSLNKIKANFGQKGLTDLLIDKRTGKAIISDDTQMTLFTADGILWADLLAAAPGTNDFAFVIWQSYLRWYYTQTGRITDKSLLDLKPHEESNQTSIINIKDLFTGRAPGTTCLSSLAGGVMGSMEKPINSSKGCGGVMRVAAPVGLFLHKKPELAFKTGCDIAAITHGHPSGYLPAGMLAMIIAELVNEKTIFEAISSAIETLKKYPNHEETLNAVKTAVELSTSKVSSGTAISTLGEGWVADEALAISLYCALKEKDFKRAVLMAVNHDGDSDSTGAICCNIVGAHLGLNGIPSEWIAHVELGDYVMNKAKRLSRLAEM